MDLQGTRPPHRKAIVGPVGLSSDQQEETKAQHPTSAVSAPALTARDGSKCRNGNGHEKSMWLRCPWPPPVVEKSPQTAPSLKSSVLGGLALFCLCLLSMLIQSATRLGSAEKQWTTSDLMSGQSIEGHGRGRHTRSHRERGPLHVRNHAQGDLKPAASIISEQREREEGNFY